MTMTMLRTFVSPVAFGAGAGAPELPPLRATKSKLAASKATLVSREDMSVREDSLFVIAAGCSIFHFYRTLERWTCSLRRGATPPLGIARHRIDAVMRYTSRRGE